MLFAVIIFASCTVKKNNKADNLILNQVNDSLKKTIIGTWGGRDGSPGWKITQDSLYYYNENKNYEYLIHNGNFVCFYKDGVFMLGKIHTIRDTLVFTQPGSGDGETKAYRVH